MRINTFLTLILFATLLLGGCRHGIVPVPTVSIPGTASLSAGEWQGVTSQGMPIAFNVSEDDTVTEIILGYNFDDCLGTLRFSDLNIPTAPDVTCIPGPCSGTITTYRAFGFFDGQETTGPYTQVNGLFLPRDRARGQAVFSGYPACGNATVQWTATRR